MDARKIKTVWIKGCIWCHPSGVASFVFRIATTLCLTVMSSAQFLYVGGQHGGSVFRQKGQRLRFWGYDRWWYVCILLLLLLLLLLL